MWYNIVGDFSHTLLMLHMLFTAWMGHYIGIRTSRIIVFKIGQVFAAVPTADAVATGDVRSCNCIVQLTSFAETIGQG